MDGELKGEELKSLEAHLASCPDCSRELAGLKQVFRTRHPVAIYPASGTGAWEAALAKAKGAKFTFGTNNGGANDLGEEHDAVVGRLLRVAAKVAGTSPCCSGRRFFFATLPKVCEQIEVPVQSGDDAVLVRAGALRGAGGEPAPSSRLERAAVGLVQAVARGGGHVEGVKIVSHGRYPAL